tara:strand:- start:357 stop:569 length:213 start_codon:yes stop_codon:yes gene_type:complete
MMNTASLNDAVGTITAILDTVDRGNPDAMFDALVEIELLSVDAVTKYGVRKLLGQGGSSPQGKLLFENAA